jgi:hypothetical protein
MAGPAGFVVPLRCAEPSAGGQLLAVTMAILHSLMTVRVLT